MHYKRLEAALAVYQPMVDAGNDPETVKQAIIDAKAGDAPKYSVEEVEEIFGSLKPAGSEGVGATGSNSSTDTQDPVKEQKGLSIPKFSTEALKGDDFKNFMKFLQSIPGNTKLKFNLMKVEADKKVRYRGVPDSPMDIIGVRVRDAKPYLKETLIPVKHALIMNGYVHEYSEEEGGGWELRGSQLADNSNQNKMFYFLAENQ